MHFVQLCTSIVVQVFNVLWKWVERMLKTSTRFRMKEYYFNYLTWVSTKLLEIYAGFELQIICFRGQRLSYLFGYYGFGALKQALQHQPYEAKSSDKYLIILVDLESEVFSSSAIAALQLSAVGLDLESRPTRIININWSIFLWKFINKMSEKRNSKILFVFYIFIYLKSWLVVQNLRIALMKIRKCEHFNQSSIHLFFPYFV